MPLRWLERCGTRFSPRRGDWRLNPGERAKSACFPIGRFSSRGLTDDERVKPELLAPGSVVLATRSCACDPRYSYVQNGSCHFLAGTSMAAPAVAGCGGHRAAVLRRTVAAPALGSAAQGDASERSGLDRSRYGHGPGGQPNFHQGFGRLDLRNTLPVPGDPSGLRLAFADVARDADEALNHTIPKRAAWNSRSTSKRACHSARPLPGSSVRTTGFSRTSTSWW